MPTTPPNIPLIGASRGLGYEMATEYLSHGWNVVATVRGTARTLLHDLADKSGNRVEIETVDICEPPGLRLEWSRRAEWDDWSRHSEGCYVLRTNLRDWSSEALWRTYIQLSEAEAAFRIHKSESVDPSHLASARGSRAGAHPGVLSRLRAVEDAGAMAEPGWSRQQSAHPPPGTRRHRQHRRHPADGCASRPRTAIALRRAPRSRPSGLVGAPRSPLARKTPHAPPGAHNVVPTLGVNRLKSLARTTETAEVGLADHWPAVRPRPESGIRPASKSVQANPSEMAGSVRPNARGASDRGRLGS